MSATIRQRLVDQIVLALRTVTVEGGFQTDAGKSVFVWNPIAIQKTQLPSLNLRDVSETLSTPTPGVLAHELTCDVVGMISDGQTTHDACRRLLADVLVVLHHEGDQRWRDPLNLALRTELTKTEMDVVQEERVIGAVRVEFRITYRTTQGDPCSLP